MKSITSGKPLIKSSNQQLERKEVPLILKKLSYHHPILLQRQ
jgi:hypothetical protein